MKTSNNPSQEGRDSNTEKPLAKNGRPFIFKTPEALAEKVAEYFDECDNGFSEIEVEDKDGNITVERRPKRTPYTMMGLANALGIDRKTLLRYSKREQYGDIVTAAKRKVEQQIEEKLVQGQGVVAGQIFWLKNNSDYSDKQEIEVKERKHITVQILEGYGLDPGKVIIDADEVESLKEIASGT